MRHDHSRRAERRGSSPFIEERPYKEPACGGIRWACRLARWADFSKSLSMRHDHKPKSGASRSAHPRSSKSDRTRSPHAERFVGAVGGAACSTNRSDIGFDKVLSQRAKQSILPSRPKPELHPSRKYLYIAPKWLRMVELAGLGGPLTHRLYVAYEHAGSSTVALQRNH